MDKPKTKEYRSAALTMAVKNIERTIGNNPCQICGVIEWRMLDGFLNLIKHPKPLQRYPMTGFMGIGLEYADVYLLMFSCSVCGNSVFFNATNHVEKAFDDVEAGVAPEIIKED